MAKDLLHKPVVLVRELASFIGVVINAFHAVLEAPLHYRCLERDKINCLGDDMNYDSKAILSSHSIDELSWWINNVDQKNGKRIRPLPITYTLRSDSSRQGWGSFEVNSNKHASGRWSESECLFHINYLELLASFYGIQSFYNEKNNVHIFIQSDNVSAVSYINNMGGMTSVEMNNLAYDIWSWCLDRNIYISAGYLPGIENVEADFNSRHFSDSTEWMLKKDIFDRLCKHLVKPNIDLFASRLNKQLDTFVSWFAEPGAFKIDAFNMSWNEWIPYIFPPFHLLGKVMNKIVSDEVDMALLVFPFWQTQSWFPLILNNIASFPVRLPRHKDLLMLAHNKERHPFQKLKMCAVIVSGKPCRNRDLLKQAVTSFSTHGAKELRNSMNSHGDRGIFGVCKDIIIPFIRLKI